MSEPRMITNLETDPHALKGRYQWGGTKTRREDGHYTYFGNGNAYMGTVTQGLASAAPIGHVVVLIAQTSDTGFATSSIWYADELLAEQAGDVYVKASRITATGRIHEVTISSCTSGVTILDSALYTPDDWEQVFELYNRGDLQYPWFAGDMLTI